MKTDYKARAIHYFWLGAVDGFISWMISILLAAFNPTGYLAYFGSSLAAGFLIWAFLLYGIALFFFVEYLVRD